MATNIESNGSKWGGEQPDPVEVLIDVLKTYPLRREILSCGNFVDTAPVWVCQSFINDDDKLEVFLASEAQPDKGMVHFSGKFYHYSHCFSIYTDEPKLIKSLTDAINENMKREDFLSQPEPKPVEPYWIEYRDGRKEFKNG